MKKTKPEVVVVSGSSIESKDDVSSGLPTATLPTKPESSMECPVCLQCCLHPARLPCGHVFCFLCLKGIAQQSRRCAMCRQEISTDYFDRPDLVQVSDPNNDKDTETLEDGCRWFYEGRNGWWQFEERLSRDLEEVRRMGVDKLETLICGSLYVIDLKALVQYNKSNPTRRRRIKRELASKVNVKGIAGIRSAMPV